MKSVNGEIGAVLWFTGLSGAGTSTLCVALADRLELLHRSAFILDGDELRRGLCSDLSFTHEDRVENVRRTAHVAKMLSLKGIVVLVALITPRRSMREQALSILPELIEIFVDAPLAVCESRDPKGLYKEARAGRLTNFTAVDSPFEPPLRSHAICHTDRETVHECIDRLWPFVVPFETDAGSK